MMKKLLRKSKKTIVMNLYIDLLLGNEEAGFFLFEDREKALDYIEKETKTREEKYYKKTESEVIRVEIIHPAIYLNQNK